MTDYQVRPDDPSQPLGDLWPPFGLRIESPRLLLRVVRESDLPQYVAAATAGVTHTTANPFRHPWNEKDPADLVRSSLPFIWSTRAKAGPDSWHLPLAVFLRDNDRSRRVDGHVDGRLIGMQDVFADEWTVLRTVYSGSWLRADAQGNGFGREMRAAMLLWAIDHFGAEYAESGAYTWNERSRRVSEGLGYFTSGTRRVPDASGEAPAWEHAFRLRAADLIRPDWTVRVSGSDLLHAFYEAGAADVPD